MYFLMNDNKDLIRTGSHSPIYKYETGSDTIKFLIPQTLNDCDMSDMSCIVECVLPTLDESGKPIGLYKVCDYDEALYKDRFTVTVPITSTITKTVDGSERVSIDLYLLFVKPDEEDTTIAQKVVKSGRGTFEVVDNGSLDSASENAFDEIWSHTSVDELAKDVAELSEKKADSIELNDGAVLLKSGESILGTIQLPDDVTWTEWK